MDFSNYKYRIKELYYSLPLAEKAKAMEEDCEAMGISPQHLRKIWGYRIGDENEAKPSQLVIIANRFNVSVEQLINDLPVRLDNRLESQRVVASGSNQ